MKRPPVSMSPATILRGRSEYIPARRSRRSAAALWELRTRRGCPKTLKYTISPNDGCQVRQPTMIWQCTTSRVRTIFVLHFREKEPLFASELEGISYERETSGAAVNPLKYAGLWQWMRLLRREVPPRTPDIANSSWDSEGDENGHSERKMS